ncbi:MAG TPA: cupin domain-containing protein [Methylibium sp.]
MSEQETKKSPVLSSVNADGIYEPFEIGHVPWVEFSHGERYGLRYQHLSSFGGGSQISVSMEILPPGKQANQAHFHLLEEEHVFVLEGALTLRLGDKSYVMSAGHYVCFPAGQKLGHALINHTAEPCRYLVLGNPHPHDVAVHTDTGRVSVKLTGEGYRGSATMGYWDGADAGGVS